MMRFINFISTPSINHHNRVKQWFVISCGTLITLIAALSLVTTHQYLQWRTLANSAHTQQSVTQTANDLIAQHAHLTKEKEALLKKAEEWEKYTHLAKKPSDLLKAVAAQTNNGKQIKTVHMVQRSMHCTVNVQTIQEGMTIAHNLSTTTLFKEIKISSFKPDNDGMEATLEGKIVKA